MEDDFRMYLLLFVCLFVFGVFCLIINPVLISTRNQDVHSFFFFFFFFLQSYIKEPFVVRREALRSSFKEVEGVRESLIVYSFG